MNVVRIRNLAAAAACILFAVVASAGERADRIWSGGPIITMNDSALRAEAIAEKGGRILEVGSKADVMKTRGPKTEVIDLEGRTLLPGFIDGHGHVMLGGLQALSANLLAPPDGKVTDIASLQQTLRDWAAANPAAVKSANLIVGFGYDNAQLKELRHPTRDDLDQVSTEVPVVIIHQSGHLTALNSKALALARYDAQTKDPPGGVIQRREGSTEPNGVLEENASNAALPALLANLGPAAGKAFAKAGADLWASFGYTTGQEGRAVPGVMDTWRALADAGELRIDIAAYGDVLADRDYIARNVSKTYSNHYRVAGAKLSIDGSPQGFTAWRDRPYYAPVGNYPPGYHGYPAATDPQVIAAIDWAFANNIQIMSHANGEAASDLLLAAINTATAKHGVADRRPILIHGQFLREDQLESYRRLDVIPSFFPMHTFYWGDWHRDHTVGPQLADNISPTGWAVTRGMRFTSHHDAPVALPNSMRVLDATVTRRSRSGDIIGPAQRVDVMSGLKALTIWAAYQQFEEAYKGSLENGKLADFVILSADPTAIDPETIDQIKVLETIKQGATVYRRRAD